MTDLVFVHHPASGDIPEEAFEISADTHEGSQWIGNNAAKLVGDPDLRARSGKLATAWAKTQDKFDRLYKEAVSDGLTVIVAGATPDERPEVSAGQADAIGEAVDEFIIEQSARQRIDNADVALIAWRRLTDWLTQHGHTIDELRAK
jgi:hypothetical protein